MIIFAGLILSRLLPAFMRIETDIGDLMTA